MLLGFRLSPGYALLVATHAGLVDFTTPTETIPPRSGHGTARLVEPGPGRLVAARAEEAPEAQDAPTEFLIRHEPHGPKPQSQRLARALEDCSRNRRRLPLACHAPKSTPGRCPGCLPVAGRAQKAIRPSRASQQVGSGRLGREELFELPQCPQVVPPADWMVVGGIRASHVDERESGYAFRLVQIERPFDIRDVILWVWGFVRICGCSLRAMNVLW